MLGLDGRQTETAALLLRRSKFTLSSTLVHNIRKPRLVCSGRVHTIVILVSEISHTGPATGATTSPFTVSCQRIPTGKLPIALWAYVRLLARMEFAVPFEIV